MKALLHQSMQAESVKQLGTDNYERCVRIQRLPHEVHLQHS